MGRFPARRGGETPGILLFSCGQNPTKKSYNLTIPPVPSDTYTAIASRITKCQPWLGQKKQLDKAQNLAQTAHENLHDAQYELRELQEQKEQALKDVQELRQAETQEVLKEVERLIQQEFDASFEKKEEQWKEERVEMETKIEEELSQLRDAIASEEAISEEESGQHPQKRAKINEGEERSSVDEEDGGDICEATKVDEEMKEADEETEEDESKLSFAKKQEYKALKKKADDLGTMKNNMGWLLVTMVRKEKTLQAKSDESKDKL